MKRGIIIGLIFCLLFMPFLYSNSEEVCEDGTEWFSCSNQQPLYCIKDMYWDADARLANYCFDCGCPDNKICQEDGSCESPEFSKNRAPYADAGLDKVVYLGEEFQLNAFDSWDKDYWQELYYSWEDSKGENIFGEITLNVVLNSEGVHEIKMIVSDGDLDDEDLLTIGVANNDNWWNDDWNKRVPIVLENKNNAKNDLPVMIKLYKIFGREFNFDSISAASIRVIFEGDETPYLIFDEDGVEGVSAYDFLIFKTDFNIDEVKTFFVYYDNDGAGEINYLDHYNDIILNENNILDNPSFEEVCEDNMPCDWPYFDLPSDYDYIGLVGDDVVDGDYSMKTQDDYEDFDERETGGFGIYQNKEVELFTNYVSGGFKKYGNSGQLTDTADTMFWIKFQEADTSFIKGLFTDEWNPSVGEVFHLGKIYNTKNNNIYYGGSFDWQLFFREFRSPSDDASLHFSLYRGGEFGTKMYDDIFIFEQPEIAVGNIEPEEIIDEDYVVGVEKMERVFRDSQNNEVQEINLEMAKNEYEFFQVLITPEINLEDVEISVEAPEGIEWDILDMRFVSTKLTTLPVYGLDDWSDPLPDYKIKNMASGKTHAVWIKLKTNGDISSGYFNGKVFVNPSNSDKKEINFNINVRDFYLSDEHHYWDFMAQNSQFLYTLEDKGFSYGETQSFYYFDKIYEHFDIADAHRVSSQFEHYAATSAMCYDEGTGKIVVDFEKNDLANQWDYMFEKKNMNRHLISPQMGHFDFVHPIRTVSCGDETYLEIEYGTPEYGVAMNSYLKQIVDYTDSKGWNKYMLLFPWAETPSVLDGNPKDYVENINNFYEAIDEDIWNRFFVLGEHFPSDYTSSIDGLFDLFQFHKGSMIGMGRGRLNELQNQGYEFGLGVPDQPMVDMPIRKYREAGWLMWDYDLIGFRYDGWTQPQYKSYDGSSIWENPMGSYFFRLNGEMTFTYPGFEIDYIVPVEQSGPVTTIRFELLRESLEDYEYFWMLQDLIVKARDKGIDIGDAENSLGRINEMIEENSMELIDDMNLLYEIRSQVADEIENLLNQMPEEKKEPEKEKCSVSKCDPGCLNPVIIFEDGCEKCVCSGSHKKNLRGFFGRISLIFWIVLVFVIVGMVTYFILRKRKLNQIREYQELS